MVAGPTTPQARSPVSGRTTPEHRSPTVARRVTPEHRSPVVVLMGVSGAGKTTVGRALARRLGWSFLDADDLHPSANVAKMRSGVPLDDADRWPWLVAVHQTVADHRRRRLPLVLACSALKERYRQVVAGDEPDIRWVHLVAPPDVLAERMRHRHGHWMPAGLLASQLADLEVPTGATVVEVRGTPDEVVDRVLAALDGPGTGRGRLGRRGRSR